MKICGFLQVYNELEKGNLERCINNLKKYCDLIAVYDDGSIDGSSDYLLANECIIIKSGYNEFLDETAHKQRLLDFVLQSHKDIDWFFWLDADEILDANGTKNIRKFCEKADKEGYEFPFITLWRSDCWARNDYLGNVKKIMLWKNNGRLKFRIIKGLHGILHPDGLSSIGPAPFSIIHYGYSTKKLIVDRFIERTKHGVPFDFRKKGIDESKMILEYVSHELFPEGCEPKRTEKPKPIKYPECEKLIK